MKSTQNELLVDPDTEEEKVGYCLLAFMMSNH